MSEPVPLGVVPAFRPKKCGGATVLGSRWDQVPPTGLLYQIQATLLQNLLSLPSMRKLFLPQTFYVSAFFLRKGMVSYTAVFGINLNPLNVGRI